MRSRDQGQDHVQASGEPTVAGGTRGARVKCPGLDQVVRLCGQTYVISNWLDFGMDFQEAIDAPRFHAENGVLFVEHPVPQTTRQALSRLSHQVGEAERPIGGAQMIYIDVTQGVLHGASDSRKDGCALGY
jgi:gamma-glutamyltranspeptidase/glutathione hydrolase